MDTLSISTGEKRIAINGDQSRVIVFNPADALFREKFYRLIRDFQTRLTEYQDKANELDSNKETDSDGMFINMSDRFALEKDSCLYIRQKIDEIFGEGTSQKAFGDALVLRFDENKPGPFEQFFDGIVPFIQQVTSEKVMKYTNKKPRRNGKHSR